MATNLEDDMIFKTLSLDNDQQPEPEGVDGVIDKATVDPNLTVQNQMTGLLSSESPYLKVARANAAQTANARGLINSSIAAGSGEKAAIESALPIAQQDAGFLQDSAGRTQAARLQTGLYETQGDISKEISAQESGQAQELEGIVQEGANFRQQIELDMKKVLTQMELGANEKQSYANSVSAMGESFMLELNNIQRDPQIPQAGKTAAIKTLQDSYRQNLETLASIYNVDINWEGLDMGPTETAAADQAATQATRDNSARNDSRNTEEGGS